MCSQSQSGMHRQTGRVYSTDTDQVWITAHARLVMRLSKDAICVCAMFKFATDHPVPYKA